MMVAIKHGALAALALAVFPGLAEAGDWREFLRNDGIAIGIDGNGVRRSDGRLSLDIVLAMLPERHLPLYGLTTMEINCETRDVSIGGVQYYVANGDPFGARSAVVPGSNFTADQDIDGLCNGDLPPGPGSDSALAFFKSVYVE